MDLKDFYFKLPLNTEPIIDDTTLRDGIQMPGLAAGPKDSAKIAQFLSEIGVERIELFHYQEPDKKTAKLIADLNLDLRVAGWCRALKGDIDSAAAWVAAAGLFSWLFSSCWLFQLFSKWIGLDCPSKGKNYENQDHYSTTRKHNNIKRLRIARAFYRCARIGERCNRIPVNAWIQRG